MHYPFPKIETINDVLPAIDGRDEFIVSNKGDYTVIDYIVNHSDTFPDYRFLHDKERDMAIMRRECRGLLFCSHSGKILSRRYHKFFNINEREEVLHNNILFSRRHHIMTKMDGSMISAFLLNDSIKWHVYPTRPLMWATMMGITDIANDVADYIKNTNVDYDGFALSAIENNLTPIFEWCSPNNRIVLDYSHPQLVLTGIRHMINGTYVEYPDMAVMADHYGIPVVELSDIDDFDIVLNDVKEKTDIEGYIVRFDDGHMVKLKSPWYFRIHKIKENFNFEKNAIEIILRGEIDDIVGDLPQNDANRIKRFNKDILTQIFLTADLLLDKLSHYDQEDQKQFAISVKEDPHKWFLFQLKENPSLEYAVDLIIKTILKNTTTGTKVNTVRHLFGNLRWEDY
ncbi:MAG: RNA ligase [Candidimonas sp.]